MAEIQTPNDSSRDMLTSMENMRQRIKLIEEQLKQEKKKQKAIASLE